MKPENRPQLSLRIVVVKNLNGENHYRLKVETQTHDEFTIATWSCRGPLPPRVLEDIQATFCNQLAEHLLM